MGKSWSEWSARGFSAAVHPASASASPTGIAQPKLADHGEGILSRLTGRMIEIIPLTGESLDNAAGAGGVRKTPLRRCGRSRRIVSVARLETGQIAARVEAASRVEPLAQVAHHAPGRGWWRRTPDWQVCFHGGRTVEDDGMGIGALQLAEQISKLAGEAVLISGRGWASTRRPYEWRRWGGRGGSSGVQAQPERACGGIG
jgi:hypothetical protein